MEDWMQGIGGEMGVFFDQDDNSASPTSSSLGLKLVPWSSWDEWDYVRVNLFSASPESIASALKRIVAWQSRGCLPVTVEVTAAIVETQQKDPQFRKDLPADGLLSGELLAMLYCMAIMRLVNGVVEKTRKKTEASIGEAADSIGIPRMLIDIRHEGSHRDLPALTLVRTASVKALNWLKSYYWEPQKNMIPFQQNETANIRKEIKSTLRQLAKLLARSGLSQVVKRGRHFELLSGQNKLLAMSGKFKSSKAGDPKKQMKRTLKNLVHLYSLFSSEVASVLLNFLLKALNSVDNPKNSCIISTMDNVLGDWKLVVTKVSNKEPDLLLMLLKALLDMIDAQESMKYQTGNSISAEHGREMYPIDRLSLLFEWLTHILQKVNPLRHKKSAVEIEDSSVQANYLKEILKEILRNCLLVSAPGNPQLMRSAMHIAQFMGDGSLSEKVNKFSFLRSQTMDISVENPNSRCSSNFYLQEEESLRQASEKLESIKFQLRENKVREPTKSDMQSSNRWVVAKSWNPCPLGMLPRALGSSGYLPVLDCFSDNLQPSETLEPKQNWELKQCSGKREATSDIQLLDNSTVKRVREVAESSESEEEARMEGVKGLTLVGGVWKRIGADEILDFKSAVRIWD